MGWAPGIQRDMIQMSNHEKINKNKIQLQLCERCYIKVQTNFELRDGGGYSHSFNK